MVHRRSIRKFVVAVSCLVLGLVSSPASANLVFERQTDTSGTGIGSELTVLTIQSNGSESGCVTWNGSADVVGGCSSPFNGADEKTGSSQTQTRTVGAVGIADARDFRVMFNPNENDNAVTLNNLVVTFYLANGTVVLAAPIDPVVGCDGAPGDANDAPPCEFDSPLIGGTGSAGLMFRLDEAQALLLNNANYFATGTNRIGISANASGTAAGGEVFFIGNFTDAELNLVKTCPEDILECDPEVDLPIDLLYTIQVNNAGTTLASNVVVTDTLPAGSTLISATWSYDDGGPDNPCTENAGVVTCDVDFLGRPSDPEPNNAEATIVIIVTVDQCGLTYNNTASVTTTSTDPDTANNTDSCSTVVGTPPDADLAIEKTGPATVTDEDDITYTITVTNVDATTDPTDPDIAQDVVVTDTLPAGVEFVSATPSVGSCGELNCLITCNVGDIAVDGVVTITVVVTAHDLGAVENCAQVLGSTDDPNAANDEDCVTTTIQGADLSVTKSDAPDPVLVGGSLVYTVIVTNSGPAAATNVVVTDNLPAGSTFVSAPGCTHDAGVVTCNIASLASGASQNFTITVTAPREVTECLENNVSVISSDIDDPTPGNNSDQECTVVAIEANLSIDKTCPGTAVQGTTGSYTITVSNAGPGDAPSVVVTDTLPAGVSLNGALPGECSGTTTITCNLGTITNGGNDSVTINVSFDTLGAKNNTASVTSSVVDPVSTNNSDSCSTTVQGADLSVTKTAADVTIGDNLVYTITVTNNGPAAADGVIVADTLPEGTVVSVISSQGTCDGNETEFECIIGTLANGASATVTLTMTPAELGDHCNTVTVSARTPADPNAVNNTDTVCPEVRDARQVPTTSEYGLMLLAMLLAGAAVFRMRL